MAKVSNTRKQRALELLDRAMRGPSFGFRGQKLTPEEYEGKFRMWSGSWILYEMIDLVPELRTLHKQGKLRMEKWE